MEGTVIRSQFGFSGRSAALASSRTTHRSKQVTTVVLLQKNPTTPDYWRSLLSTGFFVDSSLGSFFPVLPASADAAVLVRKYSRLQWISVAIPFNRWRYSSGPTSHKSLKIPNDLLEELRKLCQLLLLFLRK